MIKSFLSRVVRPLRSLIQRLAGVDELCDRLDRQQALLEALQAMLSRQSQAQQELVRAMTAHEKRSESPQIDAALRPILERLTAQQAQWQSAIETSETAILERFTDEIDRLDGYLVFHANEIRATIDRIDSRSALPSRAA
jgi:hypothetical protein